MENIVGDEGDFSTPKNNTFYCTIQNRAAFRTRSSQYSTQNTGTTTQPLDQVEVDLPEVHVVRCLTTTSFVHNVYVQSHKIEDPSPRAAPVIFEVSLSSLNLPPPHNPSPTTRRGGEQLIPPTLKARNCKK